jgi:hypothetical protein
MLKRLCSAIKATFDENSFCRMSHRFDASVIPTVTIFVLSHEI